MGKFTAGEWIVEAIYGDHYLLARIDGMEAEHEPEKI